jgi:hypothetical protein
MMVPTVALPLTIPSTLQVVALFVDPVMLAVNETVPRVLVVTCPEGAKEMLTPAGA